MKNLKKIDEFFNFDETGEEFVPKNVDDKDLDINLDFSEEEEEEEECEPCDDERETGVEASHIARFGDFGRSEVEIAGSEEYTGTEEEEVEEEEEDEEDDVHTKPWGDEGIRLERFSTFNEKKKAPKKDDKKKDDEKTPKKPDFKDFDKDGDKKEPMTKALKDKEEKEDKGGKKFEKPKKGEIPAALAAYQKKKKK